MFSLLFVALLFIIIWLIKYFNGDNRYLIIPNISGVIYFFIDYFQQIESTQYILPSSIIIVTGLHTYLVMNTDKFSWNKFLRSVVLLGLFCDINQTLKVLIALFYLFSFSSKNSILNILRLNILFIELISNKANFNENIYLISFILLIAFEIVLSYSNKTNKWCAVKFITLGYLASIFTHSESILIVLTSILMIESFFTNKVRFYTLPVLSSFLYFSTGNHIFLLAIFCTEYLYGKNFNIAIAKSISKVVEYIMTLCLIFICLSTMSIYSNLVYKAVIFVILINTLKFIIVRKKTSDGLDLNEVIAMISILTISIIGVT